MTWGAGPALSRACKHSKSITWIIHWVQAQVHSRYCIVFRLSIRFVLIYYALWACRYFSIFSLWTYWSSLTSLHYSPPSSTSSSLFRGFFKLPLIMNLWNFHYLFLLPNPALFCVMPKSNIVIAKFYPSIKVYYLINWSVKSLITMVSTKGCDISTSTKTRAYEILAMSAVYLSVYNVCPIALATLTNASSHQFPTSNLWKFSTMEL